MNIAKPEPWADLAACRQYPPDQWFPNHAPDAIHAVRICGTCEVRTECLNYAMTMGEDHGVWGGTTEAQRAKYRKRAAA